MEFSLKEVLLTLLISFVISFLMTPIFRRLAIRFDVIDRPNQAHKSHEEPVPYLGGAAIIFSFLIVGTFLLGLHPEILEIQRNFILLLTAPLFLSLLGFFDDIRNLSAKTRFAIQSLMAVLVSLIFFESELFGTPSGVPLVDFAITTLWIVGITNSLNLIDNLDGGAGGVVVISAIFLALSAVLGKQNFLAAISVVIAGSTLGFLIWNLNPARIYLGDSGALFLGCILSILIVRFDSAAATNVASWVQAFSFVAVPILDTTLVVISRFRGGESLFKGAQDHITHRLLRRGFSKKESAAVIWGLALLFCFAGYILNLSGLVFTNLIILAVLGVWVLLLLLFLQMPKLQFND